MYLKAVREEVKRCPLGCCTILPIRTSEFPEWVKDLISYFQVTVRRYR